MTTALIGLAGWLCLCLAVVTGAIGLSYHAEDEARTSQWYWAGMMCCLLLATGLFVRCVMRLAS